MALIAVAPRNCRKLERTIMGRMLASSAFGAAMRSISGDAIEERPMRDERPCGDERGLPAGEAIR
jgi:hypothetical protein